jgi:hypothetical protein
MKIEIIASETTYENLATFETIDQLNDTVRQHKAANKLKPTELAVLDILHRYSAKYTGVSFLRKGKLADMIGKSRRTVIRVCNRLEALGIIRQYEIARPTDKRQTSNAIVIQPVEQTEPRDSISADVTPEKAADVTPKKTTSSLKQNRYVHNTYASQVLPQSLTPYVRFKNTVGYFVEDPKLTNKLYGIYLAQTSYIREHHTAEELLGAGLEALTVAFTATKRKKLRNIAGYFHGTLYRLLDRLYEAIV